MLTKTRKLLLPALLGLVLAACRSQGSDAESDPTSRAEVPAVPAPVASAPDGKIPFGPMADGTRMAKVGRVVPNFVLEDVDGKEHTLAQYAGKTVVLEWFNPGCPFCVYAYSEGSLKTMPEELAQQGVAWISINSEAGTRKTATVAENRKFIDKYGMKVPLLLDPTGIVGKSYGAKTTPHMFVIDRKGVLVYEGALDNAPLGTVTDGGAKIDYVGEALSAVKSGAAVKTPETKSYG